MRMGVALVSVVTIACREPAPGVCINCNDGPRECPIASQCNPIAQTGCQANEKCTWITRPEPCTPDAHVGCAMLDGTEVARGAACAFDPPRGFDNCSKGDICIAGACETICDPQMSGGASGCDAQHACAGHEGIFEIDGTIIAGGCDPAAIR